MTERNHGRGRSTRLIAELLVVFVGVTSAFLVEGYREQLDEQQRLEEARAGILTEMARYQVRSLEHADAITSRIKRWRDADDAGELAVPGYYRIPGAPSPPTSAWDAALGSGVANMFEPDLRLALGYFYNEFLGIHENYVRQLDFIEREILPIAESGPSGFYDAAGLKAEYRVHMILVGEFGEQLRESAQDAAVLEEWLRTGRRPEGSGTIPRVTPGS